MRQRASSLGNCLAGLSQKGGVKMHVERVKDIVMVRSLNPRQNATPVPAGPAAVISQHGGDEGRGSV